MPVIKRSYHSTFIYQHIRFQHLKIYDHDASIYKCTWSKPRYNELSMIIHVTFIIDRLSANSGSQFSVPKTIYVRSPRFRLQNKSGINNSPRLNLVLIAWLTFTPTRLHTTRGYEYCTTYDLYCIPGVNQLPATLITVVDCIVWTLTIVDYRFDPKLSVIARRVYLLIVFVLQLDLCLTNVGRNLSRR